MKSLIEIFSGQRYRRNKLQEIVFAEAHERYVKSPLAGHATLDAFATALAVTTDFIVASLIYDSGIPEYKAVGTSLDREKIEDIAAYAAWRSTYLFLDDQNAGIDPATAQSENAKAFDRDINTVSLTMYPIRPKVQAAIDYLRGVESGEIESADRAWAFNDATRAAVDACFGVQAPAQLSKKLERGFKVGTPFIAYRNSIVQTMDALTSDG